MIAASSASAASSRAKIPSACSTRASPAGVRRTPRGRRFAEAGAEVSLAYVRHTHDLETGVDQIHQHEAEAALEKGAHVFGDPNVQRHIVTDPSTPAGLHALAEREGAELIVFCSDSH